MTVRRTVTTALGAAALATASALCAAPALAAGQTHTVEEVDFTIPAHPHYSDICGFPVELHVWGSFNVVTWADPEGTVRKEMRNYRFQSTSTANGVTVHGTTRGPEHWKDAQDGSAQLRHVGVVNRRIPGSGTVTFFAGYEVVVIDGDSEVVLTSVGQREDVELMCSAFTA